MNREANKPKISFKDPRELEGLISGTTTAPILPKGDLEEIQAEEKIKLDAQQLEEIRSLRINNDRLQAEVDKIKDDNRGRRNFSRSIFIAVLIWMFLVLITVVYNGLGQLKLSDNVVITLLTTATANVIALLLIVANYLFNKDKST